MFELPPATVFDGRLVAGVFLGLWLYYDRRDHQRFETVQRKAAFH